MKALINYFILSLRRDKLIISTIVLYIISALISVFFGSTAISEQKEMTTAYIAGSHRIIANIGTILFVCSHIHKLFSQKELDYFLSKPISRTKFIMSYIIGIVITAFIVSIIPGMILLFLNNTISIKALLLWEMGLFFEIIMISTFAFLCAIIFKSNIVAMTSVITFYIAARMLGLFNMTAKYDYIYSGLESLPKWLPQKILYITSVVAPRLDLFADTRLLIYGIESDVNVGFGFILLQSIIYITLLIFVAFYEINRKSF